MRSGIREAVRAEVGLYGERRRLRRRKCSPRSRRTTRSPTVLPRAARDGGRVSRAAAGGPFVGHRPEDAGAAGGRGRRDDRTLAALDDATTYRLFGRYGVGLRELARGNDTRASRPSATRSPCRAEETFEYDLRAIGDLRAALRELAADVARRLEKHGLRGSTIGVKVKRSDFTVVGRQLRLAEPTGDADMIYAAAERCLDRVDLAGHAVRLLGVRVASLTEDAATQMSLL